MKKTIGNVLFVTCGLALLFAVILAVPVAFNIGILWLASTIPLFAIDITSSSAYWLFAIGVCLFLIVAFPIAFLLEVLALKLFRSSPLAKNLCDHAIGFLLLLWYFFMLDQWIADLSISAYGYVAFALLYTTLFNLLESSEVERVLRKTLKG